MVSFSTCDRSLSPVQPQPPQVPPCPQATISLFPCLCSPSPLHYTLIGPQLMVLTAFQLKKCHPLHLPLLLSNRVSCHCCSPTQPHPFCPPSSHLLFQTCISFLLPITALTPPPLCPQPDSCSDCAAACRPYHQMRTARQGTLLGHHRRGLRGLRLAPGGSAAFLGPGGVEKGRF